MAEGHVLLTGGTDSIRTAHQAGLNITGDHEAILCVALDDWSPAAIQSLYAKWQGATGPTDIAYAFRIHSASGGIVNPVYYDTTGGGGFDEMFGSATGRADGQHLWIRVLFDADTGSGVRVRVYTSTDPISTSPSSVTWTLLSNLTETYAVTIATNTHPLWLGLNRTTNDPMFGKFYYFQIATGTVNDGTATLTSPVMRAVMDARTADPAGLDGLGNSWSLAGSASWVPGDSTLLPPSGVMAVAQSSTSIQVSWDAVALADAYDVERDGVVVADKITDTFFVDTDLTPATEYTYRVRSAREV